jgi:hypothetical protein
MNKLVILLLLTLTMYRPGVSQSIERFVVASAGGVQQQGSLSLSYTVGESATRTSNSSQLILTQGFQQPGAAKTVDTVEVGLSDLNRGMIKLYPNPTTQSLHLSGNEYMEFTVKIIDSGGKLALQKQLVFGNDQVAEINVHHLQSGQYIIWLHPNLSDRVVSLKFIKE